MNMLIIIQITFLLLFIIIVISWINRHKSRLKSLIVFFSSTKNFSELSAKQAIQKNCENDQAFMEKYNNDSQGEITKEYNEDFFQLTLKLKNSIKEGRRTVIRFSFLAVAFTVITYNWFSLNHFSINLLQILSACLILWSVLGKLGWPIQTYKGNTLPEEIDNFWFHLLNGFGIFLLVFVSAKTILGETAESMTDLKIPPSLLLYILIVGGVVFLCLQCYKIQRKPSEKCFPIVISLFALVVSFYGAFKGEIRPFKLLLDPAGYIIPGKGQIPVDKNAPSYMYDRFDLGIVLFFVNQGYTDGVIEDIRVVITGKKDASMRDYRISHEMNLKEFVFNPYITTDKIQRLYPTFILKGGDALVKEFLFSQFNEGEKWQEDQYTAKIYVKLLGDSKYNYYSSFDINVTQGLIESWNKGSASYKFKNM